MFLQIKHAEFLSLFFFFCKVSRMTAQSRFILEEIRESETAESKDLKSLKFMPVC